MSEKKGVKRVIQKLIVRDGGLETAATLKQDHTTEQVDGQTFYTEEPSSSGQNEEREVVIQSSGPVTDGVPGIDLMNFKLVRFEEADGQLGGHYRLVTNSEEHPIMTTINGEEVLFVSGDTIDIEQISKSDDSDEHQNSEGAALSQETKYVHLQMEGSNGPIVMLACEAPPPPLTEAPKNRPLQQKQYFKNNVSSNVATSKAGGTLPPPHELLSSPNFKLFLYACKQCDYQCNAIKDLTKHRAEKHGNSSRNRSSSWSNMRTTVTRKPDLSPYPVQISSTTTQKL